ncbi:glucosyltransferase domain-containing protein [Escherichia sp. WS3227_1]|uniref:glucosyltransferase domain-containing protein n=1 Tax=Escherichia TaxID=561 RepID=UPI00396F567F
MIASFAYAFPILTSPVLYGDDMGRSLLGYSLWGGIGRPLADYVMNILSFGTQMVDMSPLPQALGVLCMALTSAMLCHRIGIANGLHAFVISLLLIGNPFFLANLSFKFDAFPMCLSVLLSYTAVHIIDHKVYRFISPLLVISSLSLYQASLPIFMLSVVIIAVHMAITWKDKEQILSFIFSAILSLFVGYVIYSHFIASVYLTDPYSIKHSGITIDIQKIYNNILLYSDLIWSMINGWQLFAFVLLAVSSVFSSIALAYKYLSKSDKDTWSAVVSLIVMLCPFISAALSILPLLFLENPVVTPRVFIGMSMMLVSWFIVVILNTRIKASWVTALPLCVFMFVFCFTFTNANKQQFEFEKEIASKIGDDVSEMEGSSSLDQILFAGREPMSPLLRAAYQKFPVMYAFVPQHMNPTSWVGYITLRHNAFTERLGWHKGKIEDDAIDNMQCKDRVVYCIGLVDEVIVVRFK